jgi:hypothetical protein
MKTTARGSNIKVNVRYSAYNNVTFMTVQAGVVSMQGSAEGRGVPELWRVEVGSRNYGKRGTGELRGLTLRGRGIEKMLKAMAAGRI